VETNDVKWLVLRTRCRHEYAVETCLRQKRINSYLPRLKRIRSTKSQKKEVEVPLFPGYIFVQPSEDQFEAIRFIRGSCGLVRTGTRPATLKEAELQSVRILVQSSVSLKVDSHLATGCRVKVIEGSLAGAIGYIVRVKNHVRLVINVELINCSVSVEVDAHTV